LKSKEYIPSLDGLRGLAVLLVMIYHFSHVPIITHSFVDEAFFKVLTMGWIGVDVFFVLSGFLITRILLWSKEAPISEYLKVFYIKRSLRIFPLYYLYLGFIFLIFYPLVFSSMGGVEQTKIQLARESAPWFVFYVSNLKQVFNGMFFGAGLGHLWSLSIEEQFYIIWPFVIYFVNQKNLTKLFFCIILFCLILRICMYIYSFPAESIYVFTATRIDGLVIGGYVAYLSLNTKMAINTKYVLYCFYFLLTVCLLALYIIGPRVEMHPFLYTGFLTLLSVCICMLIWILQSEESSAPKTFFSNRILIFFGKYSYGLYIFHPLLRQFVMKVVGSPIIIFDSQIIWEIGIIVLCTGVSLIAALLSWNLFEKWFLKSKSFFLPKII
jgi:peptidoglycan/LPS O-acetylase OafA/YrhL